MAARFGRGMGDAWKRYLFHFANDHFDFKLAELKSLATTVGCKLRVQEENYDKECPFLELQLQSEEDGKLLMQRSTLGRSLYELVAEGRTFAELCDNLQKLPESQRTVSCNESFRIQVEGFNKRLNQAAKVERIEALLESSLKFDGKVNLKQPDHSFHLLEYYGHEGTRPPDQPYWLYFGRWVADGQREKIRQFHLQKRHFIGNTRSLLVACAHHGAYVMGTDIDYMLLHAKARPSRHNQKRREKDESIRANLRQYGLESQYLDVLVADASQHTLWRSQPMFDAIITDPPYGIREPTLKIGTDNPKASIPDDCKDNHHPQRLRYHLSDIFRDLLNFAARFLKMNGRLVYWLPVYRPDYSEANIPQHPCLQMVANCEQTLNTTISRRLITMEKIAEHQEQLSKEGATVEVDHYEDKSFRERYFRANRTIIAEQEAANNS
ncbi:hypothetical protein BaRGS_00040537 [Batillaria attramentaria]|uniref:tRNA (guanine(10)-N(2))-methyltransferase n=1 Tax=Batillaria attramentaria TaxID=370345 RepID=A0ABD0IZX4_9CAEN